MSLNRRKLLASMAAAAASPALLKPDVARAAGGKGEIWISNEKDDTLSVIDIETLEVVRTIPTGERPRGITFLKPDEMPRNATGKILHRVLKDMLEERG